MSDERGIHVDVSSVGQRVREYRLTREAFLWVAGYIDEWTCDCDPIPVLVTFWFGCPTAEKDHAKSGRTYAHAGHGIKGDIIHDHPAHICVVREFESLQPGHKVGILLHEFGHVYGGDDEADADLWVDEVLGIDIQYVDTVQWVDPTEIGWEV